MSSDAETFELLTAHARETALLGSIESLLGWDQQTYMPSAANAYRADQISYLAGLMHHRQCDPRVGDWLAALGDSPLAADPHSDAGATIRVLRREYDKATKLPQTLVEELARTSVLGQQAWVEARRNDDFRMFRPLLEQIVALKQQQAEAIGYDDAAYDALLDDFEPEARTADVARALSQLRAELVPLVGEILQSSRRPPAGLLQREYPIAAQEAFGKEAARQIGFDFERGRLDVTAHPFCSTMGPHDTRLTTRYDAHFFSESFFGVLHEAGHGLYDQGLRADWYGLPPGESISLGIHESQSRMWENLVGRSHAFWQYLFPLAQRRFPSALGEVKLDDFFFAINEVQPSLIRVEADEATYNLHILIRFDLEQALLSGDLKVADLPGAWNARYRDDLGIEPPNDADGVLQDVHWSHAAIGYFSTYTLGNLYASQFFEQAEADLGDLDSQFARGEFLPLLDWLRTHIHTPGRCYSAGELVERVTGQPLSHAPLMRHLRGKLGRLYGI